MNAILPFRVSICGIEELTGRCGAGVSHVVSILDPNWPVPEAFGAFGEHVKLELRFDDVIEPRNAPEIVPSHEHVAQLLDFGRDLISKPAREAHLLVHCHAGISRSTASMTLILAQALPGIRGSSIMDEVLRIRPHAWPNLRIIEIGDAQLGRGGELVAAAARTYRSQLDRLPRLAEEMRSNGRGREVAAGIACRGDADNTVSGQK